MNKKFVYGAIAITFIVAVLALFFGTHSNSSQTIGALNNFGPSQGVTQLAVGSGCDQSYSTCAGAAYGTGTMYAATGVFEGGSNSTSTPGSITMAWTDFSSYSLVSINPSIASVTLTLPASTTIPSSYLPNTGDSKWLEIHNSTSTASTNITIAAGTGSKLQVATSTAATTLVIQPGNTAVCRVFKKVNTDVSFTCFTSQN